ncbi:MAG: helix-turn-helix transcriptional regulator [Bacteroidaceae bacterium]|nr:helix-turn-helix transcriptional regulator [Bacteroidaceae bacterium]
MHNPHQHQSPTFVIHPLNTSGYVVAPPIPKVVRQTYSFLYLKKGEVLVELGEDSCLLVGNTFLLIPPQMPYGVKWYDSTEGYMGGFDEVFLLNPSNEILLTKRFVKVTIAEENVELFRATMEKLFHSSQQPHKAQLTLDFIISLLSEDYVADDYIINKLASRFMDDVFDRSQAILPIADYAKRYDVTPNHLNKVVRTKTGKAASEWVRISRLNYAKYLLHETNLTIVEVAERVGILDQSYFSRFFRQYVGVTPSEYKAQSNR